MYLVEHGADLHKAYKEEFPDSTPLVCASEEGRLGDVKLLITGRNDANGSNGDNNNSMQLPLCNAAEVMSGITEA